MGCYGGGAKAPGGAELWVADVALLPQRGGSALEQPQDAVRRHARGVPLCGQSDVSLCRVTSGVSRVTTGATRVTSGVACMT